MVSKEIGGDNIMEQQALFTIIGMKEFEICKLQNQNYELQNRLKEANTKLIELEKQIEENINKSINENKEVCK